MAYRAGELDADIAGRWKRPGAYQPLPIPVTDTERTVDTRQGFARVGDLWVPAGDVREPALVRIGASAHPRGIGYTLGALTRIRLALEGREAWIAGGWSAARLWGLSYFCDDADTCVLSGGRKKLAAASDGFTRYRREGTLASVPWYNKVDPVALELRVSPPVLTIVHCLRSLRCGEHSWGVVARNRVGRHDCTGGAAGGCDVWSLRD